MNTIKNGSSLGPWWRGQKGEYWVLAQGLLCLGFMLLPVSSLPALADLPAPWHYGRWLVASSLGLLALVLMLGGSQALGKNLTPLPHPKTESELVTTGIYAWVRHPLYSSLIFLALAYGIGRSSWIHLLGALVLFVFFDQKAHREEQWLQAKFPSYADYQTQVKKLIPGLY
jgi:protein-S-isoprenylcysteine O-methyltransferase Ste14